MNQRPRHQLKLIPVAWLLFFGGLTSCSQPCPLYRGHRPSWLAFLGKRCPCPAQPQAESPAQLQAQAQAQQVPAQPQIPPAPPIVKPPPERRIVISVAEQRMMTYENSTPKKRYPVSTSRFGVGDKLHSCLTPLGHLEITDVIGQGLPKGALLRGREPTGEVLRPNTPGHDAIVTRILRLRGKEPCNARAMQRCIYIHGTTAEKCLRSAMSWGCIRMGSRDIIRLSQWVAPGTRVDIVPGKLPVKCMLPP